MENVRNFRKQRTGVVVSDKMDKTIVVAIIRFTAKLLTAPPA